MKAVIDLSTELLVDCSRIRFPQLRFLFAAIGRRLAQGSPWLAIRKEVAALYPLPRSLLAPGATQVPDAHSQFN